MKQVWITKVGAPEVLQVKETTTPSPKGDEVLIKVAFSGINFADIMARLGLYPDSPPLPAVVGYEVSGEVIQVGPDVQKFAVGDKVIGLCRFGGYSDHLCLRELQVHPLPSRFTLEQGAALGVNYLTAYQMLFAFGPIEKGQNILIHSAGGGVGIAAIQLCHSVGARCIGIASERKHAFLNTLGVSDLIPPKANIKAEVEKIVGRRAINMVLDPVGGPSWSLGLDLLAPTGRLAVFGFSAAVSGKKKNLIHALKQMAMVPWKKTNPISLMNHNQGIIGINMGHLWNHAEMVSGWTERLLQMAEQGNIAPHVDKCFSLQDAALAHHYIQDRKNIGKVLLGG